MKLYLDPGHGGKDPGAIGDGIVEKDINLDIALRIRASILNDYENVEVLMSRTDDRTKSLTERTEEANAWGADYYLSIHCNALDGKANGYEDFIHDSLSNSSITARYQNVIHGEVMKINGLKDRGQKKANFHVLRESTMPALLTENGFIDNKKDAALIKQASWRQKIAIGHVNGLAKAFNLQPRPVEAKQIYKVIAGSFKQRDNADERVSYLKSKSISAFVDPLLIDGNQFYRVQAGAFIEKEGAERQLEQVKQAGIKDAYIIRPEGEVSEQAGYPILGSTILSPDQMNQFAKSVNPDATEIGLYYLLYGQYYGIRGDIAFAQAMLETDYLRFTGVVKPEQNNFCGLGATSSDNPGASFDTPEKGVLAHIQHLYAYASSAPLPGQYPLEDPRFGLVDRNSATKWEVLNGKWAVPGDNYGELILNIYERMLDASIKKLEESLQDVKANRK
ncbi:N-acetylmuramoyl-L-alanine amidase [Pontibacillus chungwhensis BH030062]|uniref:N-acetylmuramoyl-L-alanine amidase n=1 Tax=Pontibacillus chungwhensis BH030062 TaxID=1385513 RepID=A0A0A2URW5_9BACI|nr:N-acetylmuramoyl-L-alanine amidase [Pontibacillus chungwhensis]KGP90679.1 N-acetylmuramoyl-L-alanine amidase [Pontibacillus chungwhensis BH030062]